MDKELDIDVFLNKNATFRREGSVLIGVIVLDDGGDYHIKIDIENFPKRFPKVFELNERIPPKADRHINGDGSLCFTTRSNESILLSKKIKTLVEFVELILVPYLLNNSYYEINKKYKYGSYSHDTVFATYESYVDILDTKSVFRILEVIKNRLTRVKYRPNDNCYCNSDIKLKKCKDHEKRYKDFKLIDSDVLLHDMKFMFKLKEELLKKDVKIIPTYHT